MKNIEKLQSMSSDDFAEYIESVFIAGRLYQKSIDKNDNDFYILEDYKKWLNACE